jgi:hypothetical protein
MTSPIEIDPKLAHTIFEAVTRDAFVSGHLTEDDLRDRDTVIAKVLELVKNSGVGITVDHRQTILESAFSYQRSAQDSFSLVFYAMFFEHTINFLIHTALARKELSKKTANLVIRSANLDAKFSWLIELLELPSFSDKHRKVVLSVANERNAFVHYKWDTEPHEFSVSEKKKHRLKELLAAARKTVTYLKSYETKCLYNKRKHEVDRVTKRPNNSFKPKPLRGSA